MRTVGRDANAATLTWISGLEGPPPHQLFLSVLFNSLSFGGPQWGALFQL